MGEVLMQQFQVSTHSPHSSSPSQVSHTNRSSSPASSQTDILLTPPQSPVHEEHTYHDLTKQNPSQRLNSDLDVSNTSYTKLHEPRLGSNSTVHLPRLDLSTFSGTTLE